MKVTKKPKKVNIIYQKVISTYSIYECPTCKVKIEGAGISNNVSRFFCINCNQ